MIKRWGLSFAWVAALGASAAACAGFDPLNPTSSAPLERAIAKMGNPDCEKAREGFQNQVKQAHGKVAGSAVFTGDWRCHPTGAGGTEVWHVGDNGKAADGSLESWSERPLTSPPEVTQDFEGAHDGNSFIFYSENAVLDFSGQLTPRGQGLSGKVIIRTGSSCQAYDYGCTRM
jgi:hypothetical protein